MMTTTYIIGYITYWLGAALDFYTTKRIVVDKGGKELNKPLRIVLEKLGGRTGMLVIKATVFIGLVVLGAPAWPFIFLGVAQLLAGAWNWRQLKGNA